MGRSMGRVVRRAAVVAALVLPAAAGAPRGALAEEPVAVFAALEGDWVGTFVGWDAQGNELYRIAVKQSYRRLDATTQEVVLEDTDAKGKTTRGKGRNVATRRADGTLELRCVVEKDDGDRVEHQGRLIRGPEGDEQFVWSMQREGRSETFRERCTGTGKDARYEIDGMGRYTDTLQIGRAHV